MTAKNSKKSDETETDLTEQCINYMAEIFTLCTEFNLKYPDWATKLDKKNVAVMKRVLKISRSKQR